MNILENFSSSYLEARDKFIKAALMAGANIFPYKHLLTGPNNECLFTDVAYIGNRNAKKILIIVSGVYGIEGIVGSAIQTTFLKKLKFSINENVGILFVHAINPYGLSHIRRENEDNIDLNRNFISFDKELPVNDTFSSFFNVLHIHNWDKKESLKDDEKELIKKTIALGQYSHPKGLFFGGHKLAWSNITFSHVLKNFAFLAEEVILLDLQAGYKNHDQLKVLCFHDVNSDNFSLSRELFSGILQVEPSSYIKGSLVDKVNSFLKNTKVLPLAIRNGDSELEALEILREDNWLYNYGDPKSDLGKEIKRSLKSTIYPNLEELRLSVLTKSFDALDSSYQYLMKS